MTKANPTKLIEEDREVETTLLWRIRENSAVKSEVYIEDRESVIMDEPRKTFSKYERPWFTREEYSVQAPTIAAYNFEFKASIIGMMHNSCQFDGLADEDRNVHISVSTNLFNIQHKHYYRWCDQIETYFVQFRGSAYRCLTSLAPRSIMAWKDLVEKYFERYF